MRNETGVVVGRRALLGGAAALSVLAAGALSACGKKKQKADGPVEVEPGDTCARCGMHITDMRHVGEIIGVLADQDTSGPDQISMRGGARIDPLGAQIKLSDKAIKLIADQQKSELTKKTYDSAVKNKKASTLGLGGIAPSLDQLGGVSCREIIRSHVLSFAALRSLRFDCETTEGNVACRALLAALALNGLARSDAELLLRANCDLVESEPARVTLDKRYGEKAAFKALTIDQAQELLSAALEHARTTAGVAWDGSVLAVTGNPEILRAAEDTRDE